MSQTTDLSASDINQIISTVLATNVVTNSQSYSQSSFINQTSVNSDCVNAAITSTGQVIKADTTVFQDTDVYQSAVTDITNQITQAIDQDQDGGTLFSSDQLAEIKSNISNIIETNLTAEALNINNTAASTTIKVNQSCVDSTGSVNFYYGTQSQLLDLYTESYSSLSAVQYTTATVKNLTDASASQKTTSTLVAIAKAMALVVIGVIAIILIVIVVIIIVGGFIALKTVF